MNIRRIAVVAAIAASVGACSSTTGHAEPTVQRSTTTNGSLCAQSMRALAAAAKPAGLNSKDIRVSRAEDATLGNCLSISEWVTAAVDANVGGGDPRQFLRTICGDSFVSACTDTGETTDTTTTPDTTATNDPTMSLAEFSQIHSGMTYQEVVDIVGGPGTLSADTNIAGYHDVIYTWDGEGSIGANANVTFQNNSLVSKAQVGLG